MSTAILKTRSALIRLLLYAMQGTFAALVASKTSDFNVIAALVLAGVCLFSILMGHYFDTDKESVRVNTAQLLRNAQFLIIFSFLSAIFVLVRLIVIG